MSRKTIKNIIAMNFNNAYNIAFSKKTSNFFLDIIHELDSLCSQNNKLLNDYFVNDPKILYDIINDIIVALINVPIRYYHVDSILYNNNTNHLPGNIVPFDITLHTTRNIFAIHAHDIIYKDILAIVKNFDYVSQVTYFIFNLLIKINFTDLSNTHKSKGFFSSHIEYLLTNQNIIFNRNFDKKTIISFNALIMVLTYGSNLIIIQQSYIRRYLAKRFVIKYKKNLLFQILLYSMPKCVEFCAFKDFVGGNAYLKLREEYSNIMSKQIK